MKRPLSHQIDERAQQIFRSTLPIQWVINPYSSDYGKDHQVEIVESGELSGRTFIVQLKGKRRLAAGKDQSLSFDIKTKYIKYYLKLPLPVFLVIVDVERSLGYWLFLQEYAQSSLTLGWDRKRTIRLKIPPLNVLSDTTMLAKAVATADEWLTARRASPQQVIESRQMAIERVDPRFRAHVSLTREGVSARLEALQDVSANLTISGSNPTLQQRLDDVLERGLPATFSADEFRVRGMPLFSSNPGDRLQIRIANSHPASIRLSVCDEDARDLCELEAMLGKLEGGRKEQCFRCQLPTGILACEIPIDISENAPKETRVQLSLRTETWCGKPALALPYFDQIYDFLQHQQGARRIRIRISVNGTNILDQTAPPFLTLSSRKLPEFELLRKVRSLAVKLNVNPNIPLDLGRSVSEEVNLIYDLIFTGNHRRGGSPSRIAWELLPREILNILDSIQKNGAETVSFNLVSHSFNLFDKKICLNEVKFSCTKMTLSTRTDSTRRIAERALRQSPLEPMRIEIVGTNESEEEFQMVI